MILKGDAKLLDLTDKLPLTIYDTGFSIKDADPKEMHTAIKQFEAGDSLLKRLLTEPLSDEFKSIHFSDPATPLTLVGDEIYCKLPIPSGGYELKRTKYAAFIKHLTELQQA